MSDSPANSFSIRTYLQKVNWYEMVVGALIGGFVSYLFIQLDQDSRELSYAVRSNRSIIFDSENSLGFQLVPEKPIEIKDEDGMVTQSYTELPPDKNVYSAQLKVWNSGTLPIKPEHVLEYIGLRVGLEEVVLDVRVTDAIRDTITQFRPLLTGPCAQLDDVGKIVQKSCDVGLDWKILEPEDYAIVQVTYVGDENAEILLEGAIEGKRPINKIRFAPPRSKLISLPVGLLLLFVNVVLFWSLRSGTLVKHFGQPPVLTGMVYVVGILIVLYAILLGMLLWIGSTVYF